MEELKLLVEMVASLPEMALWVVVMFFVYKTLIVGSIYSLIRFIVMKMHDWAKTEKSKPVIKLSQDSSSYLCLDEGVEKALMEQFGRLKLTTGVYIHHSDVAKLRKAIDKIGD